MTEPTGAAAASAPLPPDPAAPTGPAREGAGAGATPARRWVRALKVLAGVAVSAGLLAYLFHDVDLAGVGARLADTRWSLLAASAAVNLLAVWVRGRRWYYLFPPGAGPTGLGGAVMIGYMANNLLPLRAGELVRVFVVRRRGQRFWTVVATLLVERVLDALAVVLILAALLLVLPVPRELEVAALVFLVVDVAAMAVLAVIAVTPDRARALVRRWTGRRAALATRLLHGLDTFSEGLRGVRAGRHALPLLFWSAATWAVWAAGIWLALLAARLALPPSAAWAVLAFVGLGVSLPSSPGFAGVFQAAVVLALALYGVGKAEALSFSLLLHGAQFFPVTLWGLALLLREHVSLSEASRAVPTRDPPGP